MKTLNKFSWINTKVEYDKWMDFLNKEIHGMQQMSYSPEREDYYVKKINERDDLINRGIELKIGSSVL